MGEHADGWTTPQWAGGADLPESVVPALREWRLVAEVGRRLAEALEAEGRPRLAGLLAPALADAAALFDAPPEPRWADFAASAGIDADLAGIALERLVAGQPPAGEVVAEQALDPAVDGGLARCRLIPLAARGRAVGWLALGLGPGREWPGDAPLAELAQTLALGLDNIRRHREAQRDQRERGEFHAALADRQALFDAIFENAGVGIAMGALEWDMLLANRAFCAIVGYSEAELRARSVMAITHPDDLARELELAQELADGKRASYQLEKRYIHKDGHHVPVHITGLLVRDKAGRPRWGLALVEDIGERRRAEAALRASEARYRSLIEQQTDLVVRWRPDDFRRTFVNDAYCARVGLRRDDLIGRSIFDVIHPDDAPLVRQRYGELYGPEPVVIGENRLVAADGSVAWFEWTSRPVIGPGGVVVEIQSVGRDITARRQAEEVRDWLVAILEASPNLVGYIDMEGRLAYLNRAARELHGLSLDADAAEFTSHPFMPPWAQQLMQERAIPTAIREGIWHGESAFLDAAGHEIPFAQTVIALRDRGGKVARLASVARDLRQERREAAERLSFERKMLETQKLESLGVMAGGIAHDFNNILAGVLGHADLMLHSPDLPPALRPGLEAVASGAQRAAELTMQILAYAGKGRVVSESLDLNRVIDEITSLIAVAATRHCTVERRLAPGLPRVEADSAQMRQLVLNLLINAAEAVGRTGGLVVLETAPEELTRGQLDGLSFGAGLAPGPYVRLAVADNGCGIEAATLERIFDPFFTTKFTGRGLGLAAVQGIVRAHRGALQVHSTPGGGTRFHIWLPVAEHAVAPPQPDAGPPLGPGAMLVIDDDLAVLEVASELLRRVGLECYTAPGGPAGLAMIERGLPDLLAVLIDLTMPEMGGEEVVRAIHKLRPGTRVVLMSGYSAAELAGLRVGGQVHAYLQKPFTTDTLREALAAALRPEA